MVVRIPVLLLERVRERREHLAVDALERRGVLELREERRDVPDEDGGQRSLVVREPARVRVVDLCDSPGSPGNDDRNDDDRLHAELAKDEPLARVHSLIEERDGIRPSRLQRVLRQRVEEVP